MAVHLSAILAEPILAAGSESVVAGPLAALGALGSLGVLGVMDLILGEDEAPEPTEDALASLREIRQDQRVSVTFKQPESEAADAWIDSAGTPQGSLASS